MKGELPLYLCNPSWNQMDQINWLLDSRKLLWQDRMLKGNLEAWMNVYQRETWLEVKRKRQFDKLMKLRDKVRRAMAPPRIPQPPPVTTPGFLNISLDDLMYGNMRVGITAG